MEAVVFVGGVRGHAIRKIFEKFTVNSAFWQHIYTELRYQAISQMEIKFTGSLSKKIFTLESGPLRLWGGGGGEGGATHPLTSVRACTMQCFWL